MADSSALTYLQQQLDSIMLRHFQTALTLRDSYGPAVEASVRPRSVGLGLGYGRWRGHVRVRKTC